MIGVEVSVEKQLKNLEKRGDTHTINADEAYMKNRHKLDSVSYTHLYHAYQVPDFKGLTGDASDNLKGVPGVGKVTATKLLAEYDTLEKILKNANNIKGKLGENIREHKACLLYTSRCV